MAGRPPSPASETLPAAVNTPLSAGENLPRASFLSSSDTSPRDSKYTLPAGSAPLLLNEDKEAHVDTAPKVNNRTRTLRWIIYGLILLAVVVLSVILPVYFTVIKPNQRSGGASSSSVGHSTPGSPTPTSAPTAPITGGDGSTVTADDGSTFIYNNKFGGFCEYSCRSMNHRPQLLLRYTHCFSNPFCLRNRKNAFKAHLSRPSYN